MSGKGSVSSNTSSNDPKMLNSRVFIGNLPSEKVNRSEVEAMFAEYGTVLGVSLHKSYGFVQFDDEAVAKKAVAGVHGKKLEGNHLDVNLAAARRKEGGSWRSEGEKEKSSSSKVSTTKLSSSDSRSHHSSRHHDDTPRRGRDRSRDRRERDRDHVMYRRRSRSPPLMPHDLDYRARMRHMERMHGFPPPPFRDPRDPYFDLLPPRDPYLYPREDPYDMRDRYPMSSGRIRDRDPYGPAIPDPYDRMLPPSRDRDLRDRELRDRELRDRELRDHDRDPIYDEPRAPFPRSYSPLPLPAKKDLPSLFEPGERPTDMEIIVVNRQQKEYADMISGRVKFFGLVVEMVSLSHTVSLADALDAAANRGLLYALIVTSQHEVHRSVTLTILHGQNPQEHKNMPVEDALALVDRDFQRYMMSVREGRIPPRRAKSEVSSLLSQVASGGQVSADQLQHVIDALQKKKQANDPQLSSQPTSQPQIQLPPKDEIQRQQADLQAKILSLLGSNAVVPSSTNQHAPHSVQRSGYNNDAANPASGRGLGVASSYGGMRGGDGGGRGYSYGSGY